jgi:protein-disulfide isomerase-like protein with CxxC motif
MTQEDLDQIGGLISANNRAIEEQTRSLISANNQAIEEQTRSLISANNQVLFEAMRAIEDHLDQSIGRLRDELGGRLAHVERRLDFMEARFTAFEFQLAGIGKSLITGERLDSEMSATQTAQQRAIDDLARRLGKVERQINPIGNQPGPQ